MQSSTTPHYRKAEIGKAESRNGRERLGAVYVGCLLLEPPREPIHAVALALKAREMSVQAAGPCELVQQRSMGLDDAVTVRALWRRQCALEGVL